MTNSEYLDRIFAEAGAKFRDECNADARLVHEIRTAILRNELVPPRREYLDALVRAAQALTVHGQLAQTAFQRAPQIADEVGVRFSVGADVVPIKPELCASCGHARIAHVSKSRQHYRDGCANNRCPCEGFKP